jgi:beta-lactamase class A
MTYLRTLSFWIIALVCFGAGYLVSHTLAGEDVVKSECHHDFALLDPALDCDRVVEKSGKIFELEKKVRTYIADEKQSGRMSRASVFFRDLETRRWFGVNADDEYYPASLAKLPLAIAYYKVSEITPSIWEQVLPLVRSDEFTNIGQSFGTDSPLQIGKSYSVKEMIENLLMYSDNRLIDPLTRALDQSIWKKTAEDLGIRKQTSDGKEEWSVSPRIIAGVLRSVYNASYLAPASSDALLSTMTSAKFLGGIVAGVPTGTKVAHKFGEAVIAEDDGTKVPTLHDCGVVYSEKPYILCVMTEGKDFSELEKAIADISSIVSKAQ